MQQLAPQELAPQQLTAQQQELLKLAVQDGLPLTPQPFQTIASALGVGETTVIETLQQWLEGGLIKRLGLVVNHRQVGYRANAMVVWDVPDEQVETIADYFCQAGEVTLCYQRPRVLPAWPYNLFCMIHGIDRGTVLAQIATLVEKHQLQDIPRDILFSYKQFKQCGGQFADTALSGKQTGAGSE